MRGTTGFVGERLTEARESYGLTAAALANLVQVSPTAISQYERGKHTPRPELLAKIASKLEFPAAFFKLPLLPTEQRRQNIYWRSFNSATKISRVRSGHRLRWLERIVDYLQEYLDFPPVNLPQLELPQNILELTGDQIEDLARECRRFWGMGDGPVVDATLLLENNGVLVARSPLSSDYLDAFSQWFVEENERPYIVLGSDKMSAVRDRNNGGHELGHLVLHNSMNAMGPADRHKQMEDQAFRFAASFLLPAKPFLDELWAPTLDAFLSLKERWKVAIGLMIKRCEDLEVVTEEQGKRLWINRTRRGWRNWEPLDDEIPIERPRLLRRSFEMLLNEGIKTKSQILQDLPYPPVAIEELSGLPTGYLTSNTDPGADVLVFPKPQYSKTQNNRADPAKVVSLAQARRRFEQ